MFPPGRLLCFEAAGIVLRNVLIAHTRAYELIKSLPGDCSGDVPTL
jgi:hypothetical protein